MIMKKIIESVKNLGRASLFGGAIALASLGGCKGDDQTNQPHVNQLPIIQPISQFEVPEGESRNWYLGNKIIDNDGDNYTIRLISGPGSFSGTGSLGLNDFEYTYKDEMDLDLINDVHIVEFLVEDDHGGHATGSFEVKQKDFTLPSPIRNTQMQEGVVLTSWWYDDYGKWTDNALQRLYDLGVESVSFLTTWYQNDQASFEIERSSFKTPYDSGLEEVLKRAKFKFGMRTILKPHVDLWNNGWRGNITHALDADWAKWFKSYTDFIMHYAGLAKRSDVSMLIIGTELDGTVHRPEWRQIISDVRSVYSGEIVYGANHDRYKQVPFWNDLDGVGVSAYFPESEFPVKSQEARDFAAQLNKKLYILEVGCQSKQNAGSTPWWSSGTYDEQEQADYYQTAFENFFNQCDGMFFWHVYHNLGDPDRFPFTGKLAERVVRNYYDR